MEEEEDPNSCWAHNEITSSSSSANRKSLNDDPTNILAEELAMEHCMKGYDVTQELSEIDMVTTSCGSLVKGTPDGGFIDSEGSLRLVQVVRVPLLPHMDADDVAEVLFETVLAKVVKSQTWMRETRTLPDDFIIFCWLPPVGAYRQCLEESDTLLWTEALIYNVNAGGWPFSLKLKVPSDPSMIFPQLFGFGTEKQCKVNYFNELSYFFDPTDFEEDEEPMVWYLFDEDCDHEDVEHDAHVESQTSEEASDVRALIAWAIQVLQHQAEEDNMGQQMSAYYDSCGFEEDSFGADPTVFMYEIVMWRDAHEPPRFPNGRREAKGEAKGRIQGRPWWGLGCQARIFTNRPYPRQWPSERGLREAKGGIQGLSWRDFGCQARIDIDRPYPRHCEDSLALSDLACKQRSCTVTVDTHFGEITSMSSMKRFLRPWLWMKDVPLLLQHFMVPGRYLGDWLGFMVSIEPHHSTFHNYMLRSMAAVLLYSAW